MIHRHKDTRIGDRRRGRRDPLLGKVRLLLSSQALDGDADNVSHSGILFFTDGEMRVEVEYQEGGVVRRKSGHLVRCERIHGNRRGWAVEFDPS